MTFCCMRLFYSIIRDMFSCILLKLRPLLSYVCNRAQVMQIFGLTRWDLLLCLSAFNLSSFFYKWMVLSEVLFFLHHKSICTSPKGILCIKCISWICRFWMLKLGKERKLRILERRNNEKP